MAEPKARADRIEQLFPWLLHWTIADERIGGFRSDAFAVRTRDGLMVIDPVPPEDHLMAELKDAGGTGASNDGLLYHETPLQGSQVKGERELRSHLAC